MKKMSRVWSVILTIAMVCSVVVMAPAAFAEEEQCPDVPPVVPMADVIPVKNMAELKDALTSVVNTSITLTADINYTEGIVINGLFHEIILNGFTLTITNSSGAGVTIINNGSLKFDGTVGDIKLVNITGKGYGVYLDDSELDVVEGHEIINVTATGGNATGVYAINNSDANVSGLVTAAASGSTGLFSDNSIVSIGNITAAATGVRATNKSMVYTKDINTTASGSTGIDTAGGSSVSAWMVNAKGTGAQAIGPGTSVIASDITATGAAGSIGLKVQSGAAATVANVTAKALGVSAQGTGTNVSVSGEVSVDAKNGIGVYAGAGSLVEIDYASDVCSTGAGGVGAHADGGKILIDGDIIAAGTGAVATAGGEVTVEGWITKNGRTGNPQTP